MARSEWLIVGAAAVAADAADMGSSLRQLLKWHHASHNRRDRSRVIDVTYYTEIHSVTRWIRSAQLAIVGCHGFADFSNMDEYLAAAICGLAMELSILDG
jgi:hypothetical protein